MSTRSLTTFAFMLLESSRQHSVLSMDVTADNRSSRAKINGETHRGYSGCAKKIRDNLKKLTRLKTLQTLLKVYGDAVKSAENPGAKRWETYDNLKKSIDEESKQGHQITASFKIATSRKFLTSLSSVSTLNLSEMISFSSVWTKIFIYRSDSRLLASLADCPNSLMSQI
nr:AlNc14C108G6306 [Albugo laibachii Nc14]|eukprot:CCA20980.1 AlNc14C108G6306 [Albugo laibachii Nc14]